MIRRLFLLVAVVVVLIGSGILTVQWGNGEARIKFDKDMAKQRGAQLLTKTRELQERVVTRLEENETRHEEAAGQ